VRTETGHPYAQLTAAPQSHMLTLLLPALLTGLLGSIHCIGMCGGIVGILTMGLPLDVRQNSQRLQLYLLTYNLGRLSSYTLAGLLVGSIGQQLAQWLPFAIHTWLASLLIIALGLYITGWWPILLLLEKLGSRLWKKLSPFTQKLLPVQTLTQSFTLGILWGWLPCGLVYTALALSLATGNALTGGMIMLTFGLGTLPLLLILGNSAPWLLKTTRHPLLRNLLGILLIALGIYLGITQFYPNYQIYGIGLCHH